MADFPVMHKTRGAYGDPLPGCPKTVPWSLVTPHERQAQRNHSQSLARLAERGGLSPCELLAVLEDREWRPMKAEDAVAGVLASLREVTRG